MLQPRLLLKLRPKAHLVDRLLILSLMMMGLFLIEPKSLIVLMIFFRRLTMHIIML
ncbi:MAG TPA: hypothetical protein [Caudoviricetes sp.]|nr:MAG TPA: hypothetical protein [Caudoviricetes sp.]